MPAAMLPIVTAAPSGRPARCGVHAKEVWLGPSETKGGGGTARVGVSARVCSCVLWCVPCVVRVHGARARVSGAASHREACRRTEGVQHLRQAAGERVLRVVGDEEVALARQVVVPAGGGGSS